MPAVGRNAVTRFMWRWHRWVYSATGGRIGSKVGSHPILQLTTTGRNSGRPRTVLLTYLEDAGDYVVVGSYVGEDRNPSCWRNLESEPGAEIAIRGTRTAVTAAVVEGERRARLWKRFNDEVDTAYQVYQDRTDRLIPVVVLRPHR